MRAGREGAGRGARAFFPFFAAALATTGLEDGVARPDRLLGDVVPQYPPLRPSSAGDLAGVRFGDFDARFGGILVRSFGTRGEAAGVRSKAKGASCVGAGGGDQMSRYHVTRACEEPWKLQ